MDESVHCESENPVLHVLVVGFHHKKGCQVEYSFPPLIPGGSDESECPVGWKYLPTLALPDGSHNYEEDTVFFHLPSLTDPERTVFGISCFRQIPVEKLKNRTADITRGTVQKSVCVLSRVPLYGQIEVKMSLITHAYFEEGDFTQVQLLADTYHHLNACISQHDSSQPFVGLSGRDLVLHWRHKALLLFKLLLLERKVVFYKSPVRPLCSTILSLLSLHPGMIETGLYQSACIQPSRPMSPVPRFEGKTKEENITKETAKVEEDEEEEKIILNEQSEKQNVEIEIVNGGQEQKIGEEERLKKESGRKRIEEGGGRRIEEEGGGGEEEKGGEKSVSRKEEEGGGGGVAIEEEEEIGGRRCMKRLDEGEEGRGGGGGGGVEEGETSVSRNKGEEGRECVERLADGAKKEEEEERGEEGDCKIRKEDCEEVSEEEGRGGGGCVKRLGEEEDCDKLKSKREIEDYLSEEKKEDNSLKKEEEEEEEKKKKKKKEEEEEEKKEEERQNRVQVENQCKEERVKRNGYVDGVTTNECKAKKESANGRGMQERKEGGGGGRSEKVVEIAREALDESGNGVVMFRRRNSATSHDNDDVTSDVDDHVTMRLPRDVSCETLSGDNSMAAAVSASDAIACGLPLRVFEQGYLCLPYLSLPYLDLLSDQNVSGYVVGATNVLFKQKRRLADVLVEVDGARIEVIGGGGGTNQQDTSSSSSSSGVEGGAVDLRRQLHLSTEDLRFADYLVRHVGGGVGGGGGEVPLMTDVFVDGVGWEGGDEWLRAQFRVYMLCLLRTSLLPDGSRELDHFNASFMAAFRRTRGYTAWLAQLSGDTPCIWQLPAGHPFGGGGAQLSVADMRLRIAHTMQTTEGGRKLNQAMVSTGRAVATTGRAVGGAISQAKGALSSWWSNLTTAQSPTEAGPQENGLESADQVNTDDKDTSRSNSMTSSGIMQV